MNEWRGVTDKRVWVAAVQSCIKAGQQVAALVQAGQLQARVQEWTARYGRRPDGSVDLNFTAVRERMFFALGGYQRRKGAWLGGGGRERSPGLPRLRLAVRPDAPAGARAPRGGLREGEARTLNATGRWIVERTNSWQNAHKKLVWCTERRGRVVDFWVILSEVVIIVRRLVREGWTRYRWEGRPSRRP